jgi:hypothetical protein
LYEHRKQPSRQIKARLDDIQARAKHRDLTWSEMREVKELKGDADKLHKRVKDIKVDEELATMVDDLGNGIHKGKSASQRENTAAFNFSAKI